MSRRSVLFAVAAVAGAVALVRRRKDAARVDVFYEDGSMVSLERSTPQAQRMLALAGEALAATRSA
jgi:uncharacterized membrane protein